MIKYNKSFKSAFTLMEIGLAILIVSILVLLTVPVISNQTKKTDEYAYYMAFKTVEKIASQIVVYGDPDPDAEDKDEADEPEDAPKKSSLNPTKKSLISSFTNAVLNNLSPKANADINVAEFHPSEVVSFTNYEYDYVRICIGNPTVLRGTSQDGKNIYWTSSDVNNQPLCTTYLNYPANIRERFIPYSYWSEQYIYDMSHFDTSAESFCKYFDGSKYSADYVIFPSLNNKETHGECIISVKYPEEDINSGIYSRDDSVSYTQQNTECSNYGLYGDMISQDSSKVNCRCNGTPALNNSAVCCPTPAGDKMPYAYYDSVNKQYSCVANGCKYNAFNEKTKRCCPEHSYYSGALKRCVCFDGYKPNNTSAPSSCSVDSKDSCAAGTHFDTTEKICKSNIPVIKAQRLCRLIANSWNTSSKPNCSTFTKDENGEYYYKDLYDKITANNTPYLSVKAVRGAFNGVKPNLVFANGLKMWILGDKSASIAGLSDTTEGYTPAVNACVPTEETESSCKGETDHKYYCKNDSKCFKLKTGEKLPLSDARNCCSSADFSEFMNSYENNDYIFDPRVYAISGFTVFIDINGNKDNDEKSGGGTLWKDVFPFFIGSNGKVYPAYPLNAARISDGFEKENMALYQGGNSSALSSNVYYYDKEKNNNNLRRKVYAYTSIPYARALCLSRNLSLNTPYCRNLGSKFRHSDELNSNSLKNPCNNHNCFIKIKNKIKYL